MTGQHDKSTDSDSMRLCPDCQAPVTRGDERAGRCPGCGRVLLSLAQLAEPERESEI
jgi:hypothetical protein